METKAAVVLPDQAVTERESRAFFIIKAIAIITVLIAHLSNLVLDYGTVTAITTAALEPSMFMGIPIFVFVSGFFYRRKPHDTWEFWKKKGLVIVLPWLIAGILRNLVDIFLYHSREPFIYYLQRLIGVNSSLYFPVFLVMLFVLFKFIGNRPALLWAVIGVNILSLTLEMMGVNYLSILVGTPSLNVFNRAGFFALGMLTRRYRWDRKLIESRFAGWIAVAAFAVIYALLGYVIVLKGEIAHHRLDTVAFGLVGVVAMYFLSYRLASRRHRILTEIGACTYCIYLYHLIIIPGLTSMINLPIALTPAVPFIGLAIMMGLIEAGKWICKLLKIKWPMTLVGLKG